MMRSNKNTTNFTVNATVKNNNANNTSRIFSNDNTPVLRLNNTLQSDNTLSQLTQSGRQARLNGGTRIIVPRDRVFSVARDLAGQDEYVRHQASGKHFAQIVNLVRSAFQHLGVSIQEADMNRYAQAVHEGRDYRFVVAF